MRHEESGFVLATVLMLLALLMVLLSAYFITTQADLQTTRSTIDRTRGFYAAEAGLNLRAEAIRQRFAGYELPVGSPPAEVPGQLTCTGGDPGSGDYACQSFALDQRTVLTHMSELPGSPRTIVVPRGELFQDLIAVEYGYAVGAAAVGRHALAEAIVDLHFRSRLVPLFQFAVFYNKDLEILPGPAMQLDGPVHSNGDMYLDCGATLTIDGQVSTAGTLYRGRKSVNSCAAGGVEVFDPAAARALPACGGGRTVVAPGSMAPWNGMLRSGVDVITVPGPDQLDPTPGALYWDEADLRVVLDLNVGPPAVEIRAQDGTSDIGRTLALAGCAGAAVRTTSLYNNREASWIELLDVDLRALLDCAHTSNLLDGGRMLDDSTHGGLVFHLGVDGPNAAGQNNYGVRVRNGANIASGVVGAPVVRGLTVATNQAMYVQGSFNSTNKKPAAFLGDSMNVLSNGWSDANSNGLLAARIATATTINAAFLAGTDVTGAAEGPAGQDIGGYNGGLENYPRFHEDWSGVTLRYRGSFISLNSPLHVDGAWAYGAPQYTAPVRDWGFDADLRDPGNLPPLSPRFVYLRQDLFVRRFDL